MKARERGTLSSLTNCTEITWDLEFNLSNPGAPFFNIDKRANKIFEMTLTIVFENYAIEVLKFTVYIKPYIQELLIQSVDLLVFLHYN